jgi:hypothetical protein
VYISDCGFQKKQKTEILLWEWLLAAISRFQRMNESANYLAPKRRDKNVQPVLL